jgi:X-Pro dipeptidyl-peptidase
MSRLTPAVIGALLLILPASAHAADVFETYSVPSVDGSRINVEVARPDDKGPVPVILTYSPYNSLSDPASPGTNIANDSLYEAYKDKGYARAYADVIGSRNSTGCWDYGGAKEIASGVDVVNFLSKQGWTNGKVAMIGGSYEGTTANMVAAQGDKAPGLASIVPQVAISRWYGYAYQDGVRYFLNSENPANEGFDTPLAFDLGFGRTTPTQISPAALEVIRARTNECDLRLHTEKGYDRTPDYDAFWRERDYLKDAENVKVPSLVTHGWQDYNVKQSEGVDFYEALPESGPFKKLFVFQGPHTSPSTGKYPVYHQLLERFLAKTLKGVDNGIEKEPPVFTETRNAAVPAQKAPVTMETAASWPLPGTRSLSLELGRAEDDSGVLGSSTPGEDSFTDRSNTSEEAVKESPDSEQQWLYYVSEPLREDLRIAGSPVLDALLETSAARGQVSPTLVDVAPNGNITSISRGHLNLRYRDGLEKAVDPPVNQVMRARTRLAPQDQTISKGHRIGLIVAGSNVVWALPDDPNTTFTYLRGGLSRLVLPVVGATASAVPGGRLGGDVGGSDVRSVVSAAPPIVGAAAARRAGRRLSMHIWRLRRDRLRVYGRAIRGQRVTFRVTVPGRKAITRRLTVRSRTGSYRVTIRGVPRRRAVRVTAAMGKLKITRRLSSRQIGNRPR